IEGDLSPLVFFRYRGARTLELDRHGLVQVDVDRAAVVRAPPGVAEPAISRNVVNVPELDRSPVRGAIPIADDLQRLRCRAAAEFHGVGVALGNIGIDAARNLPLDLRFHEAARPPAPEAAARHPRDGLIGRTTNRDSAFVAIIDNTLVG